MQPAPPAPAPRWTSCKTKYKRCCMCCIGKSRTRRNSYRIYRLNREIRTAIKINWLQNRSQCPFSKPGRLSSCKPLVRYSRRIPFSISSIVARGATRRPVSRLLRRRISRALTPSRIINEAGYFYAFIIVNYLDEFSDRSSEI